MIVRGTRNIDGAKIVVDGKRLSPAKSLLLRNHSPTGLEYGYRGSGPAQTALAILLEAGLDDEVALANYQRFKEEVIANLQYDFELDVTINPDATWKVNRLETPIGTPV